MYYKRKKFKLSEQKLKLFLGAITLKIKLLGLYKVEDLPETAHSDHIKPTYKSYYVTSYNFSISQIHCDKLLEGEQWWHWYYPSILWSIQYQKISLLVSRFIVLWKEEKQNKLRCWNCNTKSLILHLSAGQYLVFHLWRQS